MTERFDHLDPATIAALIDRTLDPAARAAAEAHLAGCADCREVWVETSEISAETQGIATTPANAPAIVDDRRRSGRSWVYAGAGLAAAVLIGVSTWLMLQPSERDRALLALQADGATHRFATGRLSAPYSYLPPADVQRGATAARPPSSVQRSALLLQELAEDGSAPALHAAGVAHLAIADAASAVEALREAAAAAPDSAAVHSDLSVALLERWRMTGETTDATRALDAARRATLLDPQAPAAQFNLALAFDALGLSSQARAAFEQYLTLDPSSPWADEARERIARLSDISGNDSGSHSRLLQKLESRWLPEWGSAVLEGRPADLAALQAAHLALGERGDASARMMTQAALEAETRPLAVRKCVAAAAAAIGAWSAAFDSGRSEDGLARAREARAHLHCAGLSKVDAVSREATSLIELNRLAEAASAADAVLADADARGFHRARARAYQVHFLVAQQQTRFSDAVAHATSAVDAAAASRDLELKAALETNLASLLSKQGDIRQAWAHLGLALRGEDATDSLRRRYSILGRAMMSAIELRLPAAALAFAEGMLHRTEGWTNPLAHAIAHLKRAEMLMQLKRPVEARGALAAARRLIPGVSSARVRADLQAQADLSAGMMAESPADGLASLDRAVEYFANADNRLLLAPSLLARGQLHERAGRLEPAEADWRRGVGLIEDQRLEIRDAQLQISRIDRVWELFEELTDLVADTRPLEALEIAERNRARQLLSSLSRTQQIMPLRGPALHDWLPEQTDALVYSVLPDRLLIWHLTREDARLSSVPVARAALEAQVSRFRAALLEPGVEVVRRAEIAPIVLPDRFVPRRALLVIPDGPLHLLPFAALSTAGGTLLADQTTIVSGASLTTAATASARPSRGEMRTLLVGAGMGNAREGLPPLPGVAREIAALSQVYPHARSLTDAHATRAALVDTLPSHSVVHVAGHAVTDAIYPNRSRLVLANSGGVSSLTSGEIAAMQLQPGTIVVLGACDTANGEIYRGEGALALSRSFFAAGAGSVVASLWKLDDEGSQRFLVDFHRQLVRSHSPAHALRITQQAWIKAGGAPSVWASFQVMGALPRDESVR